jgi:SLT domain-containing protein
VDKIANELVKKTITLAADDKFTNVFKQAISLLNKMNPDAKSATDAFKSFGEAADSAGKDIKNGMDRGDKGIQQTRRQVKEAERSTNSFKSGIRSTFTSFAEMASKGRSAFNQVGEGAEKAKGHMSAFKAALIGSAVGGAAVAALGRIKDATVDLIHEGSEYNKTQQVMGATWNTLTDSSVKGSKMVKSINDMSVAFGQSTDLVNELDQQFYHVFDNQPRTEKLTKAVLTLGDTLGMSSEDLNRLGLNFTHMMGSSLLQLGDFNMITDQLPMYGEKLLEYERKVQKNSKLTMAELRKEMSAGKISAKDAEAVMEELGDKYSKASENMMATIPGMERIVSSRMPALIGAFEKPFQKAQSGLFSGMSKWVSSVHTESLFTGMGNAASKGMTTIINAFGKVFGGGSVTDTANNAIKSLTKGIGNASNFIADHAKDIVRFLATVKDRGADAFKLFGTTAQMAFKLANPFLKFFVDHPKIFATAAIGLYSMSKAAALISMGKGIGSLVTGIGSLIKSEKALSAVQFVLNAIMDANPISLIIVGISALVTGLIMAYQHSKTFRNFVNGLGEGIKKMFGGMPKFFSTIWSGIKGAFSAGVSFVKKHWLGIVEVILASFGPIGWGIDGIIEIVKHWGEISSWLKKQWHGMGKFFSGIWSGIKHAWSGVGSFFRHAWSGTVGTVKKGWGGVAKFFKGIWNGIKGAWHGVGSFFTSIGNAMLRGIGKPINGVIKGINWVLNHVGAKKFDLGYWKVPQYAKGGQAKGLFIAGEAGPELMKDSKGHMTMTPNKATLYHSSEPVQILGAAKTKQAMNSGMIPKFASGNWLGTAWDFLKDGAQAVGNIIMHPVKSLQAAVSKFADLGGLSSTPLHIAEGAAKTLVSKAGDWIKDKVGALGNPGGSGVERWRPYALKALSMNGLSESLISKVMRQIATESGGNPSVVNRWDSNAKAGHPSMGLMQTIASTFNAYAFPGHGNIINGFDNLLAALNYAKHRYGSNLSALGHGHGYASGAKVTKEQLAWISEGDQTEYVINPKKKNALSLISSALQDTKKQQPNVSLASTDVPNPTVSSVGSSSSDSSSDHKSRIESMIEACYKMLYLISQKDPNIVLDIKAFRKMMNQMDGNELSTLMYQGGA